ncbi:DME family DMT superfamily transporter [Candidatus Mancarchaeum acidiphilum]|uniref:DME family DMT superfamily transporter n=1 Tax=Candidatus Mancarchaeum acidiphilum TaxID=1920749 RepID=A0A218NMR2_9ARCH|nr:EamA family transporter [Candidatus Mancarchaeum acidiphilum]ASI13744.1 DME family DMT superfamily transporter [Candidatus Mancarchaeum acidiphilum]
MYEWLYLVLLSSTFMGISTIIEKYALKEQHASAYSASFSILTFFISLVFLPFAKFNIGIVTVLYIYVNSLLSTAGYLLSARIYKHGNLSISAPVMSSLPMVFIIIISFFALGEKLSLFQYLALAVIIACSYLIIFKDGGKQAFDGRKYIYLLVVVSLIIALGSVLMKYLFMSNLNEFTYIILMELFISLNYMVYMTKKYGGVKEVYSNLTHNFSKIGTISLFTVAYRITYYFSASLMLISVVAPFRNSIYVIITTLAGGIIFKESGLWRRLILVAIMLVAVYYISISVG